MSHNDYLGLDREQLREIIIERDLELAALREGAKRDCRYCGFVDLLHSQDPERILEAPEHRFTGICNGMDCIGFAAHCSCGWKTQQSHQYRGGGDVPETALLAGYVNHVTEKLQQQVSDLMAAVGPLPRVDAGSDQ